MAPLLKHRWTLAILLGSLAYVLAHSDNPSLTVTAPSGTYTGIMNGTVPNVRQYLGIPYSLPPVGDRRWLPPTKFPSNPSVHIPATDFPPGCPQYGPRFPTVFNQYLTQNTIPWGSQNHTPGTMVWSSNEDCLYLAVWTPASACKKSKLPVIMFIAGGGFVNSGSVNAAWYKPHQWVQRTQAHVAVTINYRLNIMGYPNARGLEEQNLGQMDQRMALEWVRDNIEAFGGDPDHITLWGESAGAVATDFHNFAYPDDPIVTGFFMDSGSAILGQEQVIRDPSGSNFTYVASHLGCGSLNASAELSCMRKVPVYDIVTFMGQYKDNTSDISPHQAPMSFNPTVDGRLVFGNYTERYELGAYAKRPAIYSTCANEYGALVSVLGLPYPSPTLLRLPPDQQAIINNATLQGFLCPAMISSAFREKDNATTYRFLYGGNFTNVSPLPYLGPYHSADLAMLFGSFKDFNGPGPQLQYKTSDLMQDLLLAFMKDPYNGPSNMGWPKHTTGQMLLFGADGKASQKVSIDGVDAACTGKGPYNPYP